MTGGPTTDPLPHETLSPLAERADRVLAHYGYELAAATDAVDAAVPGFGGLFDPTTSPAELRAAFEDVLAEERAVPPTPPLSGSGMVLYVDGSSRGNPGPAGSGAVLLDGNDAAHDADPLASLGRPVGSRTGNNTAEYAALHLGLHALTERYDPATIGPLEVRIDSTTVIESVWDDGPVHEGCAGYAAAIADLLSGLEAHRWVHLSDHEPNPADALATVGADIAALGP